MIKNLPAVQETQERWVPSLVRKTPWKRKWQSIPVFLPGKFHGQRSLAGTVHGGSKEVVMTEHTYTHSCRGKTL